MRRKTLPLYLQKGGEREGGRRESHLFLVSREASSGRQLGRPHTVHVPCGASGTPPSFPTNYSSPTETQQAPCFVPSRLLLISALSRCPTGCHHQRAVALPKKGMTGLPGVPTPSQGPFPSMIRLWIISPEFQHEASVNALIKLLQRPSCRLHVPTGSR